MAPVYKPHDKTPSQQIYGVILAGGRSSRMGTDKAGLLWNGRTLLDRLYCVMRDIAGENAVIVSGNRPGYPHVIDENPGLGPIEGLRSVLKSLTSTDDDISLLVCPVDMPFVDEDLFLKLLEHRTRGDVVKFQGFELPALFTATKKLENALDELCLPEKSDSTRSFRHLYSKLLTCEISHNIAASLVNTNTTEDWTHALSTTNCSPTS
jgi:molybdenum cofactor guanylyltransferase